jgi:hypothetical protein
MPGLDQATLDVGGAASPSSPKHWPMADPAGAAGLPYP